MASCTRNSNGGLVFRTERPHFFKIIPSHSTAQHKLGIPRKFVQNYGNDLSTHVILKVPSGVKWKVEIKRSDGEIWLRNGWRKFAEYYSVVEGSFLVFEYVKSDSEFNVFIFDKTATEIDYPFSLSNERHYLDQEQVLQDPNVVVDEQESDVSGEISATKANLDDPFHNLLSGATTLNRNGEAEGIGANAEAEKQREKALTREEKAMAVQRAVSNFRSENPSFNVVMQPTYVRTSNTLAIPSSFARQYLKKKGDAIFNILDGRSWSVTYYSSTSAGTRINTFGWCKFVKDNELQVGDVCIFELLLEYIDRITFRVTISRYSNLSTSPGTSKHSKEKESSSTQPHLSSDHPNRKRVGRPCKISSENHTTKKIKLQSSERTPNRDCPEGQVEGRKNTRAVFKFSSRNPTFQRTMQPSNLILRTKYILPVPRKFVKNMENGNYNVKLQIDNRLWSVKLNIYPCTVNFGEGWLDFARENSLKVGDVCTFELIDSEILLIRVSISGD